MKIQSSKFKVQNLPILFCILHFAFLISCSIPNLEKPECIAARQTVKELYSYHFGSDMKFSPENLRQREKFLSGELIETLAKQSESAMDYFTATDDYPKAFRVGDCKIVEPDKQVNLGIILFWKTDARSEQKEIKVEAVKENDKWLVNKVGN